MPARLLLVLCACLAACNNLSLPPPIAVIKGPQPGDFPDAPAVVLTDEATLEYRIMPPPSGGAPQLVAVLDHYRRTKILRPEGKAQATLVLGLDGLTSIAQVVGRSIDRGGYDVPLKSSHISVRRPPGNAPHAPEVRNLVATLPQAEVGGTVEFRYQRVYLDPWNVPVWTYGGALPVLHASFGLVTDDGVDVDFLHGKGDTAIDRAPSERDRFGGKSRLRFIETNLPGIYKEPSGTHLAHRSPWTLPALRVARYGGRAERMNGWKEAARHVLAQMAPSEPKASHDSLSERLAVLRRALVPEPGFGLGIRAPQTADALQNGTPACSRDAAAFARGLLADFDKDVDVALLTGPDAPPFAESFASLGVFGQAAIRIGMQPGLTQGLSCDGAPYTRDYLCDVPLGTKLYFQPGCRTCGLGTLPAGMAGSRALIIDSGGHASWTNVDIGGPERHALNSNLHYRLEVDGTLRGELSAEAHGQVAGHWREALLHADADGAKSDTQAEDVHYAHLFGDGDGPRASGLKAHGLGKPDQRLKVTAILSAMMHPGSNGRPAELRAKDLFGTSLPQAWRAGRQDGLVTGGPRWQEVSADIAVPLSFHATPPPPTKVVTPAFEYAAGFSVRGRVLHYGRRLVLKAATVAAADWPAVYDGVEQVRAAEARPLPVRF